MDKLGFYEAVAQVIPVLLLALVLAERWFQAPRHLGVEGRVWGFLVLLLLLGGGEAAALHALYTGQPRDAHLIFAGASVGALFILVLWAATAKRR